MKLTSPGPVFYTQTRVGIDRRNPLDAYGNGRRKVNFGGKLFRMNQPRADQPVRISLLVDVVAVRSGKLAEAALQKSEARYRSLFESIDEGFCVLHLVRDPRAVAHSYQRRTGGVGQPEVADQVVGVHHHQHEIVAPGQRGRLQRQREVLVAQHPGAARVDQYHRRHAATPLTAGPWCWATRDPREATPAAACARRP